MEQSRENVSALCNAERNSYVRQRITESLLALLEERPLQEVSISELCAKAQVGRVSFYRNFESKEDVLKCRIRWLMDEFGYPGSEQDDRTFEEIITALFSHMDEHREFYGLLHRRGLSHLLKEALVEQLGIDFDGPAIEAYAKGFVVYHLYGWMEVWLERGMRESPREIEQLLILSREQ